MRSLDPIFANPRLRPILPMLYVAWADGQLSDQELTGIYGRVEPWLTDSCKVEIDQWLDPDNPPSATELQALLQRLKVEASSLSHDHRSDLVEIGMELARAEADARELKWLGPNVETALEEVRDALGYIGPDAVSEILPPSIVHPPVDVAPPAFDVTTLAGLLDGPYAAKKREVRRKLADFDWGYQYDIPKEQHRTLTTERLQKLADLGWGAVAFPGVTSDGDLGEFVATFESLGFYDLSLVVKYGVQFGLWGGSIFFLGSDKHHQKYLPRIASMDLPGCFAMSELGHGSNVRDVETVVTYDIDTDEFIVHTPTDSGRKEWIGNAARDGRMATVFAQLRVGEHDHGVHAFIVPLRTEDGHVVPGVRIEDCGHKLGLNGVDNGRIWFDHVRIPRENMLDRYASVDKDGNYHSPIASPGKRFFTMLGTLVGGRVAVGAAGLAAAKSALTIATRYATERRQFGPNARPEVPIIRYRTHQLRLLPRIARAYALSFAFQDLVTLFVDSVGEDDKRELEALAAGLKSYATWFVNDTIQECREACGGQGYLSVNRFASLRDDADIFATFEGDNIVLMQLVSKARLTTFRNQFSEPGLFGVVRFIARQAGAVVTETNPITSRQTDPEHLRSTNLHRDTLQYRDDYLTQTLARRFKRRLDDGMRPFDALNDCQDHFVSLAYAHIENTVYRSFADAVAKVEDRDVRDVLEKVRALFGLSCMQEQMGWFMEAGVVETPKARAIRTEINTLCGELEPHARHLVDAFDIPDELLAAPIGLGEAGG